MQLAGEVIDIFCFGPSSSYMRFKFFLAEARLEKNLRALRLIATYHQQQLVSFAALARQNKPRKKNAILNVLSQTAGKVQI